MAGEVWLTISSPCTQSNVLAALLKVLPEEKHSVALPSGLDLAIVILYQSETSSRHGPLVPLHEEEAHRPGR